MRIFVYSLGLMMIKNYVEDNKCSVSDFLNMKLLQRILKEKFHIEMCEM